MLLSFNPLIEPFQASNGVFSNLWVTPRREKKSSVWKPLLAPLEVCQGIALILVLCQIWPQVGQLTLGTAEPSSPGLWCNHITGFSNVVQVMVVPIILRSLTGLCHILGWSITFLLVIVSYKPWSDTVLHTEDDLCSNDPANSCLLPTRLLVF